MIYDVFLPFVIIFSIFSIIIILARKIPDISLESETKKNWLDEEAKKQHRATVLFCKALLILEKTLRQFRIHILKLDAKIFSLIQYLRGKSAKKLEEINRLTYKNFISANETRSGRIRSAFKTQSDFTVKLSEAAENILPPAPIQTEFLADISSASKKNKIFGFPNKISTKLQSKIEERKLLHTIAKNPKNSENYKKLGMLYLKNKNFLDAEAAFSEYLKLNPFDSQIKEMAEKIVMKNQKK